MTNLAEMLASVKQQQQGLEYFRSYFKNEFPNMMTALRLVDTEYTEPKRRKGFNLVKRENKKLGFVYYVRYSHQGKMLPTKWNTHTNIAEEAEKFARENRDRLIGRYLQEHDANTFKVFEDFFKENSNYLAYEQKRSRPLSDTSRRNYDSVINNKFIPFLKSQNIGCFEKITLQTLCDFQDSYLAKGIKPQTVNDYLKAVKRIFFYLARKGFVRENPCASLRSIPVHQDDRIARGCYDLKKLKGVFNKKWEDQLLYLLCLIIYTTGMRNGEIRQIRLADVIRINCCYFINISKSKTQNGIRMVPLHNFAYRKLIAYAKGKEPDAEIFKACSSTVFSNANAELCRQLKLTAEEVDKSITFYSGRHFWKTLMNSEGLGEDAEEIFMGHKVSGDVAKLYNHRDKQGKKIMVRKARQEFSILDRRVFTTRAKQR
jgi:integrase